MDEISNKQLLKDFIEVTGEERINQVSKGIVGGPVCMKRYDLGDEILRRMDHEDDQEDQPSIELIDMFAATFMHTAMSSAHQTSAGASMKSMEKAVKECPDTSYKFAKMMIEGKKRAQAEDDDDE